MSGRRRALIAAGGTGGHFYPAFALAQALVKNGWETVFLVRKDDPARAALDKASIAYVELGLRGLPRGLSPATLRFCGQLVSSMALARRAARSFQPSIVLGMGGYLTFPAAFAGWRAKAPVLLHESNALLGLANRASAPFSTHLALGLPLKSAPSIATTLTGTPVRQELLSLPEAAQARRALGLNDRPTLLIFGGSQGAHGINQALPLALGQPALKDVQVLHLSGQAEESEVRQAYGGRPATVVRAYLHEMEQAYAAADLIVCRAGASTIAELVATKKPALLIPFPAAAANHQEVNARVLESAGAARCRLERDLEPGRLAAELADLISSSRLRAMQDGYAKLALPAAKDTVARLAALVENLAAKSA